MGLEQIRIEIKRKREFWEAVREIAKDEQSTVAELVAEIDKKRQSGNLSSAVRLFVLDYYKNLGSSI